MREFFTDPACVAYSAFAFSLLSLLVSVRQWWTAEDANDIAARVLEIQEQEHSTAERERLRAAVTCSPFRHPGGMTLRIRNDGPGTATVTRLDVNGVPAKDAGVFSDVNLPHTLRPNREWDLPFVPCDEHQNAPLLIAWKDGAGNVDQYESALP